MPVTGTFTAPDAIPVAGSGVAVTLTLTIDTAAYSIGDVFGGTQGSPSGEWKIPGAMRVDGGSGYLMSIVMASLENIKPTGIIYLFSENPSVNPSNNAAPTWNAADDGRCIGHHAIVSGNWQSAPGGTRAMYTETNINLGVRCSTGQDLYAIFVLDNAPDYTAATVFYVILHIIQN